MKVAKKELTEMEDQLATLQKQVDAKKYEVMDLQIVLDGLEKRRQLQQQFLSNEAVSLDGRSKTSTHTDDDDEAAIRTGRSSRGIKRVRVIDDDEDDDDEVKIVEPPPVKKEAREASRRMSVSRRVSPEKTRHTNSGQPKEVSSEPMSDYFWGRVDVAKLLVQPRIRNIPDGCARKIRHLAFNPIQQDVFATSSDDGGLILWKYTRNNHEVSKVVSFAPTSFRKEAQCPESIAWSPGGDRLAIAFRDPVDSLSEFCVARLHELSLTNSSEPLVLPRDRLKAKSTTLHTRGISAIEWIPSGYGEGVSSRGLVTAGSDHGLVMWEEHEALKSQTDFKWRVLHREHRSDVRSICMHSQRNSIYTGGLDGLVIRYDMNSFRTHTVMERRRPHISKINAVLENPHNPNLLLISSVEQSEHNLLLHDLRERYDEKRQSTMTLSWVRSSDSKSMSQYIVPRWSPGGFHVSCGSTSGLVNVWDVRVRGPKFPYVLPQQSINVHQKQVLHATWHPRYDAMFSVSHDRSLGLLTFR
ncbi:hypothetical protein Poli38472_003560 [Pythium oligandrum]|uniref:Uncharacterized protein n=1 Tax=Pythium oligandrum TaxID=41045 RepID=A0A8K1C7B6_PYTOL|nr:hypothetical protein Poli38472_003560 [Pythium oligandrum]|eukprot:TMW57635.1 hypothetical protein Poli38472_003560 [Pythium oligandrum]